MSWIFTKQDIVKGAIVYTLGDTIATLILGEFNWVRFFGIMFIGATLYAFEVPNYFKWIEEKTKNLLGTKRTMAKTFLAITFFNPLWIARHIFFIKLFTGQLAFLNQNNPNALTMASLWHIALQSFLAGAIISFIANYIIQNKIKLEGRFLASAIFSGLMAIFYAFSETLFK
jgi:hypothetical protein